MATLKQRLAELEQAGFELVRDIFVLGRDYGLNTKQYEKITYPDGLELVTDFTSVVRSGDFRLTERTHARYIHCRDGEMPTMLRFMQPWITEAEMAELIRPLDSGEKVRAVDVGKRKIAKLRLLVGGDIINYHLDFQLHRILERAPFFKAIGLGNGYDFLLPHPDYYSVNQ